MTFMSNPRYCNTRFNILAICLVLLNNLVLWRYYGEENVKQISSDKCTPSSNQKSTHGLRAIVTGLEHSGTTLTGSILYNIPCVIGAFETGYLIAESPKEIETVHPWFLWNMKKSNRTNLNYRLVDEDVEAMKNVTDFMQMYDILRQRSYLFNNLNDEEYCETPYQMVDKTPRYIYPAYFEQVLEKTPGVPVIVTKKNFNKLKESWDARKGNLTQQFYDEVFDNVWKMKMKYKGRILIIHEEDVMEHPEATMQDVFNHIGIEFKTEYLQMTGLLKKFSNDAETCKRIEHLKFQAGKHSADRQQSLGTKKGT